MNSGMATGVLGTCLIALAGCGQSDDMRNEASASPVSQSATMIENAAPEERSSQPGNAAAPDEKGAALPPSTDRMRFVGSWAASEDLCRDTAWQFTETSLHTPAGSVCEFIDVKPAGGGYDIKARCTAEGPPTQDVLKIRFAESAKAMLFESSSIADVGLIYCGR